MPDETPAARYQRLARETLETANTFPHGRRRDALLQMAQVWHRLADQYADATPPFSQSDASEQPAMQQQQQVQPKDEDKS
jgi:hypothetical protein